MNDEQRVRSVAAMVAAARLFHTQVALASIIGKSQSHVSRLVAGDVEIDAVDAVNIDKQSNGKIPRHELRPDLWDAPKRPAPGMKYWEASLPSLALKTGDTLRVKTEFIDGDFRVVDVRRRAMHRKINERAADAGGGDAASTPRERTHDGTTRTGKLEDKEKASRRQGRARTQGRQGQKAERSKGKGDRSS